MHEFALMYSLCLISITNFDVLLTIHLSIILVIDQLNGHICALICQLLR